MKKLITSLTIICFSFIINAQTIITLQPDSESGKDAFVHQLYPNNNHGNSEDFISFDWTFSGAEALGYSLLAFDLSSIPQNVNITDAKLALYHNPTSSSAGHKGNNACNLKLITTSWEENIVTWNTTPTTTDQNQITLISSENETQNYEDINILNFVTEWYNNPELNNGVMLEMIDKNLYHSMKFCSSDNSNENLRPKLIITYEEKIICTTLQPDSKDGKDAFVHELYPEKNYGDNKDLITFDWTFSGQEALGYSLLEFDLSSVPQNITITSANLSLYHNTTSLSAGHSGNNASNLKLITSSWNEYSVTWNNMPTSSNQNQILLATSDSETQNYENINVLNFATNWHNNSQPNYGILLEVKDKNLYQSMNFCSSDHAVSNLRPKLEVCYQNQKEITIEDLSFTIFPNPSSGQYNLKFRGRLNSLVTINVFDTAGRIIFSEEKKVINSQLQIDISNAEDGVYIIQVQSNKISSTTKVVKQ